MEINHTAAVLQRNLTFLRRRAGLTQEQFAEKLGLSFQAVSKWENGLSCPDISLLPEIAGIYGVEIGQLFTPIESDTAPSAMLNSDSAPAAADPDTGLDNAISHLMQRVTRRISQAIPPSEHSDLTFDFHWDNSPPPSFETALPIAVEGLPWEDDGIYRAVLFRGRTLVTPPQLESGKLAVEDGLDSGLLSAFSVNCAHIEGDVLCVLGKLNCGGIEGDVQYCATVNADAVEGDVQQCGHVCCDEINGSVVQCQTVHCDEINMES